MLQKKLWKGDIYNYIIPFQLPRSYVSSHGPSDPHIHHECTNPTCLHRLKIYQAAKNVGKGENVYT